MFMDCKKDEITRKWSQNNKKWHKRVRCDLKIARNESSGCAFSPSFNNIRQHGGVNAWSLLVPAEEM